MKEKGQFNPNSRIPTNIEQMRERGKPLLRTTAGIAATEKTDGCQTWPTEYDETQDICSFKVAPHKRKVYLQ